MKRSLLFVAGHLPAVDGPQAGMRSSYHLCRVLARHFDIHLLCFLTKQERDYYRPGPSDIFRSQQVFPIDHGMRVMGILKAPWLPLSVSVRNSAAFRKLVLKTTNEHRFDVAILDHTAMWQFADQVRGVPVVCGVAHDVLSQMWERRAGMATGWRKPLLQMEAARIRRWESRMLGRLTIASPYSEKDCELFREIAPNACVQAIQPWFSKLDVQVRREPQQPGKAKNVLFWGALTRPENQDCVRFTLDEILPRIRKLIPDVHYYAAGAVSDELRSEWSQAGVTVTGFVDDVPGLFSKMDVALLPLRLGAGIKIKVLESFSAGLAVVTSHVGIEGIPALEGFHYLLGTSAEEYAEHVARLLSNPAAAHEMGRAAQEFIRSHFAFDNSAESLAQSLIACLLRSAASITTGPEVETSGANQPK